MNWQQYLAVPLHAMQSSLNPGKFPGEPLHVVNLSSNRKDVSPLVGAYPVSCMNCEDVTSYTSWWTIAKRGTMVRVNLEGRCSKHTWPPLLLQLKHVAHCLGLYLPLWFAIPNSLLSSHIDKSPGTCSVRQHTWSSLWFAITTYLLSSHITNHKVINTQKS